MLESNFNLVFIIKTLKKWKSTVAIVCLIALAGSTLISFLLPVYYKSTAIFYPYSPKSYDPKYSLSDANYEIFGNSADVDRILQIGNSTTVANFIIKKYDLVKRYDIDTTDPYYNNRVIEEFHENFTITKNNKGAIEVSVLDEDRDIAASMANDIVRFIDTLNRLPTLQNNKKIMGNYKKSLELFSKKLDTITKNYPYTNHASLDKEALLLEVLTTRTTIKELDAKLALIDADIRTIHIIEHAFPAEKKSKPIRWLIVASSTIFTFIFLLILILFLEYYQENKHYFADAN